MSRLLTTVLPLGLLALIGCSSDPIGRTVPVKGTVSTGSGPLKTGTIAFWPDAAKGNKVPAEPSASIGEDGSYELFTAGRPGAPPGWYKVTVTAQAEADAKNPYAVRKSLIDTTFALKDKTPLQVEVVDAPAAGQYDLKVK
jgi:hypothetical protein